MTSVLSTSPLLVAGWLGVVAGFAVAIPLGPIGLLIVDRGMRHGRKVGLAAAAGVATTDLAYAVLALTATAWAARIISPVIRPATYLAAAVIVAIGVRGLLQSRERPNDNTRLDDPTDKASARPGRAFAGFAALTAINPATVLYFTALTVALTDRLGTLGARSVFLAGVALASFGWQAALATFGAHLGRRPRPVLQLRTRQAGSLLLLVLAALLVANAE